MKRPPDPDDNAYTPPGYEPLFDRYWKARRRAQWLAGFLILSIGIGGGGWLAAFDAHSRATAAEATVDSQAEKLAAFMSATRAGITPADIIEQLVAERDAGKVNLRQRDYDIARYRKAMAACGCEELFDDEEFAGEAVDRPLAGEVAVDPTRTESR